MIGNTNQDNCDHSAKKQYEEANREAHILDDSQWLQGKGSTKIKWIVQTESPPEIAHREVLKEIPQKTVLKTRDDIVVFLEFSFTVRSLPYLKIRLLFPFSKIKPKNYNS